MTLITAIELENFQSIGTRTRIDLRPITLIYGPNSAGKSAVFDAIEFVKALLDPESVDDQNAIALADRWARRSDSNKTRKMFIAVEFPYNDDLDSNEFWAKPGNKSGVTKYLSSPSFDQPDLEGSPTARIELQIRVVESENSSNFGEKQGVFCVLDESKWTIGKNIVVQLSKKFPGADDALGIERTDWPTHLRLREDYLEPFTPEQTNLWIELYEKSGFVNKSLIKDTSKYTKEGKENERPWITNKSGSAKLNTEVSARLSPLNIFSAEDRISASLAGPVICTNARDIMFFLASMLFNSVNRSASLVRADRRSPRPEEVLTVVDLNLGGWWKRTPLSPSSTASLFRQKHFAIDDHFQGLAEAAHAELLLRTAAADYWGSEHALEYIGEVKPQAKILENVNWHLERNLFTDKLYRLECASTLMVPIDLDEDDPWSYYALAQPSAVRLFLRDGTGHAVDLYDVGSGISYVLPVLYALCRQNLVQLQQPELHLHPALQASLGDVLIEESHREGFGQILIETHSEHLLLRLLRRIRDTELGKSLSDDVKLAYQDIAIYYFDPQPSGETLISRQNVSPLGDFYHDWPRGFFAERNIDLFDND